MTIKQMVDNGLISYEEGEVMSNNRANQSYNQSQGPEENYRESRGNLDSTLEGLLQAAARSGNEEVRLDAIEAQEVIAEFGGYSQLSDEHIQHIIDGGVELVKLDSTIQDSFDLVVSTANIYNDRNMTDEALMEQYKAEDLASRNSEKEEGPTLTRQNPSTGDIMVLIDGTWKTDDGSVEFSEMHLDAIKAEANQGYNEAVDGGVSDDDYMASLETR